MKERLYLNPEKCEFEKIEVDFCGAIISGGEIDTEMGKIKCIVEWKTPKNLRELRKFLGFANYYRKHIEAYSHIVKPLTNMMREDKEWTWKVQHQVAF